MTQGGAPLPTRAAANFSGWDQKFLAGQLLPPFISSFPFGSEEAISRHFHPSQATSPPPLIHKGARRRLPGHVGGTHSSSSGRGPRATRRLEAPHPATRHPGGLPSGPTPTQHERCHPLADGADGVRQRRRRPRPPAPRLGNQGRPADRLALLRGPQQPHHDVERPARALRGPQGNAILCQWPFPGGLQAAAHTGKPRCVPTAPTRLHPHPRPP